MPNFSVAGVLWSAFAWRVVSFTVPIYQQNYLVTLFYVGSHTMLTKAMIEHCCTEILTTKAITLPDKTIVQHLRVQHIGFASTSYVVHWTKLYSFLTLSAIGL